MLLFSLYWCFFMQKDLTVLIFGAFDGIHAGHLFFLRKSKILAHFSNIHDFPFFLFSNLSNAKFEEDFYQLKFLIQMSFLMLFLTLLPPFIYKRFLRPSED